MKDPTEILTGVIFYSHLTSKRKEVAAFMAHNTLILMVEGQLSIETAGGKTILQKGDIMLVGKNQLATLTKIPSAEGNYETIVIVLQEDLLRTIALEEKIEVREPYTGSPFVLIPPNDFMQGYFQSVLPYVRHPDKKIRASMGMLKVREGVTLLLYAMPSLNSLLFDFSAPYKIDLKKFMLSHYHFNLPVEKFAQLTGRSLAAFKRDFKKVFDAAPRQWLLEKRLVEARHLIEKKNKKPSAIYLDLGFESLSHFSRTFKKMFGKVPSACIPAL
ncbi:AraC family transcriptional regulator [Chitinophaga sancti]|uniref:AraC family transcriptional regulator n=1 Tax=Chitinophaga sancti TaxID=1004 RepID=A0A1K1M1Y3_9BACT|nr:AraC family transcriptional regulator [Chitinophaga sancti]WQD64694.1 AraC family transcriptional regulator [Chitinophaga sancti]WQG89684.1 AraC family transcriptional regulator [Chitinophaga sancti]SFW17141.1 AraC-type DNA-binding protein [Chitinophaga sancti]